MGAWGVKPLDNDTALDWMGELVNMDTKTLANTLNLLCNSTYEEEAVLGVFIIDTYNNGLYSSDLCLYDYGDWFKKLSEMEYDDNMYHASCGEYGTICRVIDGGAENWFNPKERLNELKKLKKHINNGTHKWKNGGKI